MWLAYLLIITVLFVLIAGVLSGGIFTIILLPLAVVVLVSALVVALFARASGVEVTKAAADGEGPNRDEDPLGSQS